MVSFGRHGIFHKSPCVFLKSTRSPDLSHTRTVILHFSKPPDVLGNSSADQESYLSQTNAFLNHPYLLNRNSDLNVLYMKFD